MVRRSPRRVAGSVLIATVLALGATGLTATAAASPTPPLITPAPALARTTSLGLETAGGSPEAHELSNPQESKRRALRDTALREVIAGTLKPEKRGPSTVAKMGHVQTDRNGEKVGKGPDQTSSANGSSPPDQYVELSREKTDKIFVLLVEFGNQRHPDYPDEDTAASVAGPTQFDGPLHNEIAKPDRAVDNSTNWVPDFSRKYFQNLYFGTGDGTESLKRYYEAQSSGRYSVDGQVTDWVKVKYNEARYGRSDGYPCAGTTCSNTWDLLRDGMNQWVADQTKAGRTQAQIAADLRKYDTWDRYDYDHDGNFNEPDGYLDHYQVVHAGGDQADLDPTRGEDAIWSHRWRAFQRDQGITGPRRNRAGGLQIGHTGIWIADYTMQPENGGLSVFAHEYGHDLGLADDYDLAGNSEASVEWWSLMAQSRLSGAGKAVGTSPGDLGTWEKMQLGWLDYEIAVAGSERTVTLGPAEYNSSRPQAMVVVLPKKRVSSRLPAPPAGKYAWWSGQGDNVEATLTRQVTIPAEVGTSAEKAKLTMKANWNIEDCGSDLCDRATVEVDDGSGWKAIHGSITNADAGEAIKGDSDGWVPADFDMSAYAGHTVGLRLHYTTDISVVGLGFFVDSVSLTAGGSTVFSDDAETATDGWAAAGFTRTTDTLRTDFDCYYLVAHRSYTSYDRYLETGPYDFGQLETKPDWADHFAYRPGVVVTYWDTSQRDNNTSAHPGEGRNLIVDAHPEPVYRIDGKPWRSRIQLYDAAFGRTALPPFTLHVGKTLSLIRARPAQPVFDDTKTFWFSATKLGGVKVRHAGIKIAVTAIDGTSATVHLSKAAAARP
jgi:immune inhibitor A